MSGGGDIVLIYSTLILFILPCCIDWSSESSIWVLASKVYSYYCGLCVTDTIITFLYSCRMVLHIRVRHSWFSQHVAADHRRGPAQRDAAVTRAERQHRVRDLVLQRRDVSVQELGAHLLRLVQREGTVVEESVVL